MAQQDEAVVFGVLEGFGVLATGEPRGKGLEHRFQRQLLWSRIALMTHRDVRQITRVSAPTNANADELSAEWIEIGGFRVEGNGGQGITAVH